MVIIYFILWLILNGRADTEVVAAGIIIAFALNYFMTRVARIQFAVITPFSLIKLLPGLLLYAAVLVIEIIKANFAIIKLVLAHDIDVEPCIVRIKTKLKSRTARVAFANSITLTPGTISVNLSGNDLLVHALNHDFAQGLYNSTFERLLSEMERSVSAYAQS
ncbi:MAG: Na+/H+ antiporter subunit E [Synergistaceae bacterium]|nr:Na+/H+ antiporter subunit E [Synergistaceae bacterium]